MADKERGSGYRPSHPVVELLLRRIESHPEEFERVSISPWRDVLMDVFFVVTPADKRELQKALRDAVLDHAFCAAVSLAASTENRR